MNPIANYLVIALISSFSINSLGFSCKSLLNDSNQENHISNLDFEVRPEFQTLKKYFGIYKSKEHELWFLPDGDKVLIGIANPVGNRYGRPSIYELEVPGHLENQVTTSKSQLDTDMFFKVGNKKTSGMTVDESKISIGAITDHSGFFGKTEEMLVIDQKTNTLEFINDRNSAGRTIQDTQLIFSTNNSTFKPYTPRISDTDLGFKLSHYLDRPLDVGKGRQVQLSYNESSNQLIYRELNFELSPETLIHRDGSPKHSFTVDLSLAHYGRHKLREEDQFFIGGPSNRITHSEISFTKALSSMQGSKKLEIAVDYYDHLGNWALRREFKFEESSGEDMLRDLNLSFLLKNSWERDSIEELVYRKHNPEQVKLDFDWFYSQFGEPITSKDGKTVKLSYNRDSNKITIEQLNFTSSHGMLFNKDHSVKRDFVIDLSAASYGKLKLAEKDQFYINHRDHKQLVTHYSVSYVRLRDGTIKVKFSFSGEDRNWTSNNFLTINKEKLKLNFRIDDLSIGNLQKEIFEFFNHPR